jgi:hypothetical protein
LAVKKLRRELELAAGPKKWRAFCQTYAGDMRLNEWKILEQDLGLYFVEGLEG